MTNTILRLIKSPGVKLLLGLLLGAQPVFTSAIDFSAISVRQLLTQCLKQNYDPAESPSDCNLYIAGFAAAIQQLGFSDEYCFANNAPNLAAIKREFVEWAIYHSEEYDSSASSALANVIGNLYPCDNSHLTK